MDRWEYLIEFPFTLRHHVAEYFVKDQPLVIDVGTYKRKLNVSGKLICIDPLKTLPDSYHGTVCNWIMTHLPPEPYGFVTLGLHIEGGKEEWDAFLILLKKAKVAVMEYSLDHEPSVIQIKEILQHKKLITKIEFNFPNLNTPGFVTHPRRQLIVLE